MGGTMRAIKVRMYPNREQERLLNECLGTCCRLYNLMIEHCNRCHENCGRHPSRYDMQNMLPGMKAYNPMLRNVFSQVLCDVCARVSRAYDGFFRRAKENAGKAGYPRFRSWKRYDSFTYTQKGFRLSKDRLRLSPWKMDVRIRGYREMPGKLKTCTIVRKGAGPHYRWEAVLVYERKELEGNGARIRGDRRSGPVGIDLGLSNVVVTSDGRKYPNRKGYIQAERRISKILRRMSKYGKGSPQWEKYRQRLFHAFEGLKNAGRGYIYEVVNDLVDNHDMIVMEDLSPRNLIAKSVSRGMRKTYKDASWGRFIFVLGYKAEEAGIPLVKVDPAYTSQLCSRCGIEVPKDLSVRRHLCQHCGLDVDRD